MLLVPQELKVPLGLKEFRVFKGYKVLLVPLVPKVLQVIKEFRVSKGYKGLLVPLDLREYKDPQDNKVFKVS